MTIDSVHPARLREVLDTTARLHVLVFDDGEPHPLVTAALARRRHPTRPSCHVTDYFDAESALWRARSGDHVLVVGHTEALEEGLLAARARGFRDDEIALVPFDSVDEIGFCPGCGAAGSEGGPACVGCDLPMPGIDARD